MVSAIHQQESATGMPLSPPSPARVQVQLRSGQGWVREAHNLDKIRPEIIGWIYFRRWTCIFFLWAGSVTCPRFLKRPANSPAAWMVSLGQNGKGDKVSRSHETVATWVKVSESLPGRARLSRHTFLGRRLWPLTFLSQSEILIVLLLYKYVKLYSYYI